MILSQAEFEQAKTQNRLRLTLIGMSNIGKSYTAKRIERAFDFKCHEIDMAIAKNLGKTSMQDMANWMGFPYEKGYADNAQTYLKVEETLSMAAIDTCGNQVIDTTGSIIHTNDGTKNYINKNSLVIYIKANTLDIAHLKKQYLAVPKPTIWGRSYYKMKGLTPQESLLACFNGLLEKRASLYEAMADITIKSKTLRDHSLKDEHILGLIKDKLPLK